MQAISINEFHAPRWSTPYQARTGETLLLGRAILGASDLDSYGLFILIGIGALVCYVLFYNVIICIAMKKLSCKALLLGSLQIQLLSNQKSLPLRPDILSVGENDFLSWISAHYLRVQIHDKAPCKSGRKEKFLACFWHCAMCLAKLAL